MQQPPSITAGARVRPGPLPPRYVGQPNLIFRMVELNLIYAACGSGRTIYRGTGDGTGIQEMQSRLLQGCNKLPQHILPPFYNLQECLQQRGRTGACRFGRDAQSPETGEDISVPHHHTGARSASPTAGARCSRCVSSCPSHLFACEKQPSK